MWLKIIIVGLFIAILASLTSAMVFLLKDINTSDSKRTLYALGIRITLAALLVFCIWYGYANGILSNTAPWAGKY
ncbi:hypothetical protein NBRC116493_27460 [Aurantivibrio infirmus]